MTLHTHARTHTDTQNTALRSAFRPLTLTPAILDMIPQTLRDAFSALPRDDLSVLDYVPNEF